MLTWKLKDFNTAKKEKFTKEFGQPNLSYPSLLIENIHTLFFLNQFNYLDFIFIYLFICTAQKWHKWLHRL